MCSQILYHCNQNRTSRTVDPSSASSGTQNPSYATSGNSCINMVKAKSVVIHVKYYGTSQPDLRKEPTPTESPLHI